MLIRFETRGFLSYKIQDEANAADDKKLKQSNKRTYQRFWTLRKLDGTAIMDVNNA